MKALSSALTNPPAMTTHPKYLARLMEKPSIAPFSQMRVITPGEAAEMLKTSTGNRRIRTWYVDVLAASIRRGEWICSHQGIAFDKTGALRDGHHRLMACVQAGMPIEIMITTGLPEAIFDVVDQGINRNVSDILQLDKRIAESLRLGTVFAFSQQKPTIAQIRQVADAGLMALLHTLIEYSRTTRKYISSAPVKLVAAVQMYRHPDDAQWILGQYKAACLLDFDAMAPIMKILCKQIATGNALAGNCNDAIARAMLVFSTEKSQNRKLFISQDMINNATSLVRDTIKEMIRRNAPA